jgi:hypothetical protein
MTQEADADHDSQEQWRRECGTAKTLWVIATLGFWVSLGILLLVFWLGDGELNLILVSVVLGLLVVGVWLKLRYQLLLRKGGGGTKPG